MARCRAPLVSGSRVKEGEAVSRLQAGIQFRAAVAVADWRADGAEPHPAQDFPDSGEGSGCGRCQPGRSVRPPADAKGAGRASAARRRLTGPTGHQADAKVLNSASHG